MSTHLKHDSYEQKLYRSTVGDLQRIGKACLVWYGGRVGFGYTSSLHPHCGQYIPNEKLAPRLRRYCEYFGFKHGKARILVGGKREP